MQQDQRRTVATEGVVGFFGASSVERLPTERAITEQVAAFKNLEL